MPAAASVGAVPQLPLLMPADRVSAMGTPGRRLHPAGQDMLSIADAVLAGFATVSASNPAVRLRRTPHVRIGDGNGLWTDAPAEDWATLAPAGGAAVGVSADPDGL